MWGGFGGGERKKETRRTTPFLDAVRSGDAAGVSSAIRDGVDASAPDDAGQTALSVAAEAGHVSVVEALIHGDPNLPLNHADKLGHTPLFYAASNGHIEVLHMLLTEGAAPGEVDQNRCTALLYAAAGGHSGCVALLATTLGADVNHCDQGGHSSLMLSSAIGDTESVKCLLANNADPNLANAEGVTALMFACMADNYDAARLLLQAGTEVDAANNEGLQAGEMTGDVDIQRLLHQYAAQCQLYRRRFSVLVSVKARETSYGWSEMAEDIQKGMLVELRFYESESRRQEALNRLRGLSPEFVATLPVQDWAASEVAEYVFTDRGRHGGAFYCMVVAAGEQSLEEVLAAADTMSFMETMHIFRSLLQCVEHLHSRNVVHCALRPGSFRRFYDGMFRIVDLEDSRSGSEFYLLPRLETEFVLNTIPPELASCCLLRTCTSQATRRSRDMWSLGTLLLFMLTGQRLPELLLKPQHPSPVTGGDPAIDEEASKTSSHDVVLRKLSEMQQETVDGFCRDFLQKGLRTYSARFPEYFRNEANFALAMANGGNTGALDAISRKSPAVRRMVELVFLLQGLLAVNPHERPTCAESLQCGVLKLANGGPSLLKTHELMKLQAGAVEAEARQLAMMEEMAADLKTIAAAGET